VEGDPMSVIELAEKQMAECRTNACVANGKAYGNGFGLVTGPGKCLHAPDAQKLFAALEDFIGK
jgi:hypothetical protein